MVGKKVSDGLLSWKGADLTHEFYIGYADIDTKTDVLKAWIESHGVRVVSLTECARRHNKFASVKLTIRKKDTEGWEEWDWPEGVTVRRFFNKSSKDGAANGLNSRSQQ